MLYNLYEYLFPWNIEDDQLLFYIKTFRLEDIAILHNRPLSSVQNRINKIVKKMIINDEPLKSILEKTKITENELRTMINNYNLKQLSKKLPNVYSDG